MGWAKVHGVQRGRDYPSSAKRVKWSENWCLSDNNTPIRTCKQNNCRWPSYHIILLDWLLMSFKCRSDKYGGRIQHNLLQRYRLVEVFNLGGFEGWVSLLWPVGFAGMLVVGSSMPCTGIGLLCYLYSVGTSSSRWWQHALGFKFLKAMRTQCAVLHPLFSTIPHFSSLLYLIRHLVLKSEA